jgi:hypothetical protein
MRYIPQSRYSFDEIVEQCRAAINRPAQYQQPKVKVDYVEVLKSDQWDKEFELLVW